MKQTVRISTYSMVMSALGLLVPAAVLLFSVARGLVAPMCMAGSVIAVLGLSALFYMPLSVSVDDEELCINRPLRVRRIALADIESVRLMRPTMGERRLLASGGWFGYWGRFSERDLGRYFGYYGRASDCFLVRLRDGRLYMLGCDNPGAVVDYINHRIGT